MNTAKKWRRYWLQRLGCEDGVFSRATRLSRKEGRFRRCPACGVVVWIPASKVTPSLCPRPTCGQPLPLEGRRHAPR